MRDRKISILLLVSFLLLLASFLILCTWVYNYYTKDKAIVKSTKSIIPPLQSEVTRDSLLRIYTATIQSLESKFGSTYSKSDSLESRLSLKLDGYYRLKDELAHLLKNPTSNDDFKVAKQKVSELQQKMEELRTTSADIEQENARLYKILDQINKERHPEAQNVQYIESAPLSSPGNPARDIPEKTTAAPFSSNELSLSAVNDDTADEQDPFSTQRKIIGSFTLTNPVDQHNSEVLVVVLQPNGQVLQKSAWESGSFQTQDGKKVYSLKMMVDCTRGEAKKLTFSIATDKFTRGNYTLQLYNNGVLIGKITKLLA